MWLGGPIKPKVQEVRGMRYRRLKLDRRGDISSPIIVILVTVAALAVAGMAIAWMASTGSRASSQGSLIVVGTPTVTSTSPSTLYITIKNIGNADATISSIRVGSSTVYGTYSTTFSIPAGSYYSTPISLTMTGGSFNSSNIYPGTIVSSVGTILFSALCQ
jgi:hypothetical protein